MTEAPDRFAPYLASWRLDPDGPPIETATSWLLPVRHRGAPAMLKRLKPSSDEADGIAALRHFAGDGALALIEASADAVLMERAVGPRSLAAMALSGEDDAAARILAATAMRLHRPRPAPPPEIASLRRRFRALFELRSTAAVLDRAATMAERLFAEPRDVAVLHGDLHHENVLDSPRGWLAIDPKGAIGEATYDLANLFCNPAGVERLVLDPARASRLALLFAEVTGFERQRILAVAFAHAGLATSWNIEDGIDPRLGLAIAAMLETLAG